MSAWADGNVLEEVMNTKFASLCAHLHLAKFKTNNEVGTKNSY
jgi:hypothetical protein